MSEDDWSLFDWQGTSGKASKDRTVARVVHEGSIGGRIIALPWAGKEYRTASGFPSVTIGLAVWCYRGLSPSP